MISASRFTPFDPINATVPGSPVIERRLSDLRDVFADTCAYDDALNQQGDALVYTVTSVTPADGDGQLHYGIGKIMPGRIGQEYYLTRGHFHAWRVAAEVYVGLSGTGLMLLEDETGQTTRSFDLIPNSMVYVPGHTAHRTVNTGDEPLTYIGIYPSQAGHDYGTLAERNFSKVVIAQNGKPTIMNRDEFLRSLNTRGQS